MGKKIVAGLVIFRQSDLGVEYLMLKPTQDGKDWSPPKGRLDEDEDTVSAALRETQEEVGYTVEDLHIYKDQVIRVEQKMKGKAGKTKSVTFYLAKLKNTDKAPTLSHEHSEYRWVNKDEASSLYGSQGDFASMFDGFDSKIVSNQLA